MDIKVFRSRLASLLFGMAMWMQAQLVLSSPPIASPNFVAPKLNPRYLAQLAQLPDWNGRWLPTASGKPWPAPIVFDPAQFYAPPDPAGNEDTGVGLKGPLPGTYLTGIPYNREWLARYRRIVAETEQGYAVDRVAACEPYGFPRIMGGHPAGPEIFVTPDLVLMVFNIGGAIRHIYTDGRGHPKGEGFDTDVNQRWNGHSIGSWEGDTLIVDTIGIFPSNYDQTAAPHSDRLHVVERIRLLDNNTLEVAMTMNDPVAFTRPWHVVRHLKRHQERFPNASDDTCAPDEYVDMSAGYQRIVLPAEREAAQRDKK